MLVLIRLDIVGRKLSPLMYIKYQTVSNNVRIIVLGPPVLKTLEKLWVVSAPPRNPLVVHGGPSAAGETVAAPPKNSVVALCFRHFGLDLQMKNRGHALAKERMGKFKAVT